MSDRGLEGPPDLVVEILSPSTAKRDRTIKRDRYAFFGVPQYWVVDPDARQVEVYRPQVNPGQPEVVDTSLVWQPIPNGPALTLHVRDLFEST